MEAFFSVFAEYAARHGLENALKMFNRIPADELEEYRSEYQARVNSVQIGYPPKILSAPGHKAWYPGPLDQDRYWPPFSDYLKAERGWPKDRVELLDEASSKIVAFTKDPSQESFLTKALVVGHVQSGKTTNFTAVIAKSADVAYRLVIVLSGIHNGLRQQTQERLQEQLLGLREDAWFPLTSSEKDFQNQTVKATAYLQQHSGGTVLCVVKKNQAVLKKLYAWLKPASDAGVFTNIPVLIVDDEADQASVATKTINPQILKLLKLFQRCTYLGYTATPFANVLIDPAADDLYPETFILNLPRPDGYFGTERIFGRDAVEGEASGTDLDGNDMVRIVPDDTVDLLRPGSRKAAEHFTPSITAELRDAVRYFWLATAARRCRGDRDHSTMLVHTSMKTSVHESYREPLETLRDVTLAALDAQDDELLKVLQEQWEGESRKVPAAQFGNRYIPFAELAPQLRDVIGGTRIVLDNYRSRERLDYSASEPITAIAVGGNTLSRGLTLEGLIVSFFVRSATTYDTLLQMGRWFGFRPGYEDLPRIWMTDQLRSWFRHLATVEHEIRLDIERYEEQDLSPREVGVRIRTHPVLNVTRKMGASRTAYASYGGRRVQTRYFRECDSKWLSDNAEAAQDLVEHALASGAVKEDRGDGEILLRDVDVQLVLEFLERYHVHEDSADLDPRLVASYILKENNRDQRSLLTWNVAIMGRPLDVAESTVELGPLRVGVINRSKLRGTGGVKADIKTLMSKEHRVADLRISAAEARAQSESALVELRERDSELRERGLLLLYPIDKASKPDAANERTRVPLEANDHVMGLALVFPGNAADKVANRYVEVNTSNEAVDPSEYEDQQAALTADDDL
ncbi:Z1 domain-containing protein [Streptacidiphilus sp. N1-10]|uniref:Z1 domain-containing protein n=1 Tax=Streptacidiphilus jeojiensis TaxID=3229225 RepID=A0ABV6XIC0_9ACTN